MRRQGEVARVARNSAKGEITASENTVEDPFHTLLQRLEEEEMQWDTLPRQF